MKTTCTNTRGSGECGRPVTAITFGSWARIGGFAIGWCSECAEDVRDDCRKVKMPCKVGRAPVEGGAP